ncbi:hypothetical protein P3T76_015780 [Phytophthora citrophthora]|uniref:Uncharacterized protein n=1 Tax=Phytophthora citrophthora TaxID=4793 RepID=A0AAD9FZ62_9STRA|nr:hypothetical protein P3T76_015780 [Phytophthora citrophthora]
MIHTMSRSILPVVLLSVSFYQFSTAASTYGVYAYYADSSCDGTPYGVYTWEDPACTHDDAFQCSMFAESDQMYGKCSTDYLTTMRSMFGSSPYILQVTFNDSSCSIFDQAYAVPATGNCEGSSNESTAFYVVVTLDVDGETSIQILRDLRSRWMTGGANECRYVSA